MARFGPVRRMSESHYEQRRRDYAALLPTLDEADAALVQGLERDGIAYTTFDELAGDDFATLAARLQGLRPTMDRAPAAGETASRPSDSELMAEVDLFRWGLSDRMLDIVERYLGMPAWYYGADVRREIADGAPLGLRKWHKDVEDRRMLKVLVWLGDAEDDGGQFGYLPLDATAEATTKLRYASGFVSDRRMAAVIPSQKWQTATGPAWTAVCVDTARLFHRTTPPSVADRYSVTFTWTSRHPVTLHPVPGTAATNTRLALSDLNARQVAALPPQWRVFLRSSFSC